MDGQKRSVDCDYERDQTRWTLVDVDVHQCPRCGLRLRVTVEPPVVDCYPLLLCGRCLDTRRRRVAMDLVVSPNHRDPQIG